MGSGVFGETAPSYMMATTSGTNQNTTIPTIGFPETHSATTLLGDTVASCLDPWQPSCPDRACNWETSSPIRIRDIDNFLDVQNESAARCP